MWTTHTHHGVEDYAIRAAEFEMHTTRIIFVAARVLPKNELLLPRQIKVASRARSGASTIGMRRCARCARGAILLASLHNTNKQYITCHVEEPFC